MVTVLGFLAYVIPDINLLMNIAGGVFGIPMIFLFPAFIAIKNKLFKNTISHILLIVWFIFWLLFTLFTIYSIYFAEVNKKKTSQ